MKKQDTFIDYIFNLPIPLVLKNDICRQYIKDVKKMRKETIRLILKQKL